MRILLASTLLLILALLGTTGTAEAFHEIESFSRAESGGGNGAFFTGSPRFKGYDCGICHTEAESRISIELEVSRPELLSGSYALNTGYAITVRLLGEHRGLESAFNPNTFMLEFLDSEGQAAGEFLSGPAPTTLIDERRIIGAEGFGEGETEWSFTWFSPREAIGAITLYAAMVDGDGAGEPELRWIDPLNDDVATLKLRLCPEEGLCPEPPKDAESESRVQCSASGSGAASWLWIALVLCWLWTRGRRLALRG